MIEVPTFWKAFKATLGFAIPAFVLVSGGIFVMTIGKVFFTESIIGYMILESKKAHEQCNVPEDESLEFNFSLNGESFTIGPKDTEEEIE